MTSFLCKGSFALGSACGKCDRCLEEAGRFVSSLYNERGRPNVVLNTFTYEKVVELAAAFAASRRVPQRESIPRNIEEQCAEICRRHLGILVDVAHNRDMLMSICQEVLRLRETVS